MATTIEKRTITGFVYNEKYSAHVVTETPAPFTLVEGQTYIGTFDDIEYTKTAYVTTDPNQNTVIAIGGEEEDSFCIMYDGTNDCVTFLALNEGESHNITTPADADNVVLKNYHGTNIAYDNVNYVALKKTDGSTATFVSEHLVQNQIQADWNQTDETAVDYIKNKPETFEAEAELPQVTTDDNGKVLGVVDGAWSTMDAPSGGGTGGNCSCPTGTIEKEEKIEYTMTEVPNVSFNFLDTMTFYKTNDRVLTKKEILSSKWTILLGINTVEFTISESDIISETEDVLFIAKEDYGLVFAMFYNSGEMIISDDEFGDVHVNVPETGTYILLDSGIINDYLGVSLIVEYQSTEEVNFVQSNWNQNDSTKPDYIKNRPFYISSVEVNEKEIISLTDITFTNSNGSCYVAYIDETSEKIALWNSYWEEAVVIWDGKEYNCRLNPVKTLGGLKAIGNIGKLEGGTDTGEPFTFNLAMLDDSFVFQDYETPIDENTASDATVTHNVSVKIKVPKVKEILSPTTYTLTYNEGDSAYTYQDIASDSLVDFWNSDWDNVTLIWGNIPYKCQRKTVQGITCIGNANKMLGSGDTGEPFLFAVINNNGQNIVMLIDLETVYEEGVSTVARIISLVQEEKEVVKIDPKFIGDIDYETKVINKPFESIASGTVIADETITIMEYVGAMSTINYKYILEGAQYIVMINDVSYHGVKQNTDSDICVLEIKDDNNISIAFIADKYGGFIVNDSNIFPDGEYTIKVSFAEDYVKKLDPIYLPDSVGGLPESTVDDSGKVLTVDINGEAAWTTPASGLPEITPDTDEGKVLKVVNGVWTSVEDTDKLPTITDDVDEGKFLRIVNGAAVWATIPNAEEVGF